MVLLLVLVALLLYKYRYRRHVKAFLGKVLRTFRTSPYTRSEKKRSSIGTDLLFTDGGHERTSMHQKWSMSLPAPVTHPDPAGTRPESPDDAPSPISTSQNKGPSGPSSLFCVSSSPTGLPQTPPPTVPRQSSHKSLESISITSSDISLSFLPHTASDRSCRESLISLASSGVFSSFMLSWAAPPSVAPSVATPSPARSSDQRNLSELAARYRPLTPMKPTTSMQPRGPITSVQPETPPR